MSTQSTTTIAVDEATGLSADELGGAVKSIVEDRRFSCPEGDAMHRAEACSHYGDEDVDTGADEVDLEEVEVNAILDDRRERRLFPACPQGELMHDESSCDCL